MPNVIIDVPAAPSDVAAMHFSSAAFTFETDCCDGGMTGWVDEGFPLTAHPDAM